MSDTTPNLALPYIVAAQAQKHITHNEALRQLDALVHLSALDRDLTAPPANPANGDRYIVPSGATGAWAGSTGKLAAWQDGGWTLYAPQRGWLCWVADESKLYAYNGGAWTLNVSGLSSVNPVGLVGVNTTADTTNKLAVKSNAALFSHDDVTPGTGDVRLILNKKLASGTASFLFQDNFSGRAEVGLTGDDRLSFRVSANGTTWQNAIIVDQATGNIGLGTTPSSARLDLGAASIRSATAVLDRPAGSSSEVYYQRNTVSRWNFGMSGAAESGGNAGSDFYINRFADNGGYLGTPFNIVRSSGEIDLFGAPVRSTHLYPANDNLWSLGSSGTRWAQVWAANGTIQTSDARDKTDIEPLRDAAAARMVDAVEPVTFRWRVGGYVVVGTKKIDEEHPGEPITEAKPGARRHAGFIAQDVRAAMSAQNLDFAAWGLDDKNDETSRQWLRPDQLVPVLWAALRETRARLAQLETQIGAA